MKDAIGRIVMKQGHYRRACGDLAQRRAYIVILFDDLAQGRRQPHVERGHTVAPFRQGPDHRRAHKTGGSRHQNMRHAETNLFFLPPLNAMV